MKGITTGCHVLLHFRKYLACGHPLHYKNRFCKTGRYVLYPKKRMGYILQKRNGITCRDVSGGKRERKNEHQDHYRKSAGLQVHRRTFTKYWR